MRSSRISYATAMTCLTRRYIVCLHTPIVYVCWVVMCTVGWECLGEPVKGAMIADDSCPVSERCVRTSPRRGLSARPSSQSLAADFSSSRPHRVCLCSLTPRAPRTPRRRKVGDETYIKLSTEAFNLSSEGRSANPVNTHPGPRYESLVRAP